DPCLLAMKASASASSDLNSNGNMPGCDAPFSGSSLFRLTSEAPRNSRRPSLNSAVARPISGRSTKTASRSRPRRPSPRAGRTGRIGDVNGVAEHPGRLAGLPQLPAGMQRCVAQMRGASAACMELKTVLELLRPGLLVTGLADQALARFVHLLQMALIGGK